MITSLGPESRAQAIVLGQDKGGAALAEAAAARGAAQQQPMPTPTRLVVDDLDDDGDL
jgi:hypothetical protein